MRNPFSFLSQCYNDIRSRREQRRCNREAQQTLHLWALLEKLFDGGLLSFDYTNRRLFITQSMAVLMMQHGTDGWVQAVHNIYEYVRWMQTRHAWEEFMQKEEMTAVRKALAQDPNLRRDDIERIKHARRQEITIGDMEPPKTEPFEFLIIPDSTEAKVEPIAIGHYDPTAAQMEVATWEEVKPLLQSAKDMKTTS